MARKIIFVSDLTGKTIDEKDAATVTTRYADARRGQVVLDVIGSEIADLAAKGTKQALRGRKPKAPTRRQSRGRRPYSARLRSGTTTVGSASRSHAPARPQSAISGSISL